MVGTTEASNSVEHGCQLRHTLQTWQGMVVDDGRAKRRPDAVPNSFFEGRWASVLADAVHLLVRCTGSSWTRPDRVVLQNLWACTGGQGVVTERTLLEYIRHQKRLDVEQAVAMVLAFVPREVAGALAPHVAEMLVEANMWREGSDFEAVDGRTLDAARGRKIVRVRDAFAPGMTGVSSDERFVLDLVMHVRRARCGVKHRLQLPKYLIPLVPEKERGVWSESYKRGCQTVVEIEADRMLSLSKRGFARVQRWLLMLDGRASEKSVFIRKVEELKKEILYGNVRLDALQNSTDRAALAYSFMAVQRRLQLKVVSDLGWRQFLKKGQGSEVLQNRPDVETSFEAELARHATDVQALVAIRPPLKVPDHENGGNGDAADELIDRVCTLMEDYVLQFGEGRFDNLRYSKIRKVNRNGRGPESAYNLLVDLLATLRERGNGGIAIGPCDKFLAKDIMQWNNAWREDAFAPGKVPGWVQWLQARHKLRLRLSTALEPLPVGVPPV